MMNIDDEIVEMIDKLIIKKYENFGGYNTDDLNDIIIKLIQNHTFTSVDSIQSLIYDLEKLQDLYKGE